MESAFLTIQPVPRPRIPAWIRTKSRGSEPHNARGLIPVAGVNSALVTKMLLSGSILNLRAAILRPQSLLTEQPFLYTATAGKSGTGQ